MNIDIEKLSLDLDAQLFNNPNLEHRDFYAWRQLFWFQGDLAYRLGF